jgi:hypothetical protein
VDARLGILTRQLQGTRHNVGDTTDLASPAFGTNWVDYGGFVAPYFAKRATQVALGGVVTKTTATASGNVIFTLPAGFRPSGIEVFTVSGEAGIGRVDVSSNGDVIFRSGTTGGAGAGGAKFLFLSGITFDSP